MSKGNKNLTALYEPIQGFYALVDGDVYIGYDLKVAVQL